jgi:hypothetical protein
LMDLNGKVKGQNAIEYLLTHMWAFVIIVVVLAALFSLGLFSNNLAPKAQPGSCYVNRPYGPGTDSYMTITGTCGGQLPEFVAQLSGGSGGIITASPVTTATNSITMSAWVYWRGTSGNAQIILYNGNSGSNGYGFFISNGASGVGTDLAILLGGSSYDAISSPPTLPQNVWTFITLTRSSTTWTVYINGAASGGTGTGNPSTPTTQTAIGTSGSGTCNGLISNVQFYNTALSANDLTALYIEGIGGAPVSLQNLVAWWPLNGNGNDYSGNNQTGTATNVIYTAQWTTGYTPP